MVDDGSKAPLESVVAPFCNLLDLILLTQANSGPAAARNTGAARARGEFLAFTDDDCRPSSRWLETLAARFTMKPDHMIGGRTLNVLSDNIYSTTSQLLQEAVYKYYNEETNQKHFFATNNVALPADCFRAIRGFDHHFPFHCEDREFCDRWLRYGYLMTYAPEVLVFHAHRLTFRKFCKQHFNSGRGTFLYHKMRVQRDWGPVKADPNFYLHVFRYPAESFHRKRLLLFEAIFVLLYAAKTAGFLWEKALHTNRRSAN